MSKHKVQEIKFKIFRRCTFTLASGKTISTSEYMTYAKMPGCARGEKVERTYPLVIPKFE